MAQLIFNIPDNQVDRIVAALAINFAVDPTVSAVKQAIAQTIKRWIIDTEHATEAMADAAEFEASYVAPTVTS